MPLRDRRPARARWNFAGESGPTWLFSTSCCPTRTGWRFARACGIIRKLGNVPIIFLTARVSETDRILGLELGANDYIVKPFFIRELIARIKNQFRTQVSPARTIRAGSLELDRASCRVLSNGQEVSLTATEFRLLEFLMSRPGVVYSREQLLDSVWGHDRAVTDRTVDVYILRLRQKIETDSTNPVFIRAVRGFGYSFNETTIEAGSRASAAV